MPAPPQHLPPNVPRMVRRARRAFDCGELHDAERLYNAVLAHRPQSFDALHGLGEIHYRRGRLDTALVLFQEALKADLGRAEGFASLGLVFYSLREFERALASFDEGLRLAPDDAGLRNSRGVVLLELGRLREALDDFERALAADPGHLDALGNRGNTLFKLNQPVDALAIYDRVLKAQPENAQLWTNRAIALRRLERPHEALMSAQRALAARPDFAPARFVESAVRLYLGDFAAGWHAYEWRSGGAFGPHQRQLVAPRWLGKESLAGRTILLHAEQGFGDTIQFVRYAPFLAARGARVVLEVQPQLVSLLSGMPGVATVVPRKAPLPPFDFHCPLLSLPLALGTALETIPAYVPYITPPDDRIAFWRARLPPRRPLVGVAWAGERAHDNDLNRSMRFEMLKLLFDIPNVQFVSLQHDVREHDAPLLRQHPDILQIGREFTDFAHTAGAIACLDAVISVDTAIAHLAGAMAKPLFVMLPFAADFRWLRERSDSPWYPTARLFRQRRFGDWSEAIGALRQELLCATLPSDARKLSA